MSYDLTRTIPKRVCAARGANWSGIGTLPGSLPWWLGSSPFALPENNSDEIQV